MTVEDWLGSDNKLGIDIWTKKYQHNGETFDEWLDRVSGSNEDIKQLIVNKKFLFGGRILANRGLNKGSLANCATLGRVPDSINGIMSFATKLAITFKAEQGQGLSFTDVRPKGTKIQNTYESDGIIPFMELFNTTTQAIMQGGHRRGALLMALNAWHKEAPEFITIKSDLNKINNANLSLEIDDEFMSIVQKDYIEGTKTVKTIKKNYSGNEIVYTVCPIELYKLFCKYAWKTAEPGILYTDRLFNYNLMQYVDEYQIFSTNACVTGDTEILTDNGYVRIEDVVNKEIKVWNGFEWSNTTPFVTGHNKHINCVKFSDGSKIYCTDYHKIPLINGLTKLQDCSIGDKIEKFNMPIINGNCKLGEKIAYTAGFFSGDGYMKHENQPVLYLYDKKKSLVPYFVKSIIRVDENNDRVALTLLENRSFFKKDYVPDMNVTIEDRLNWLAGLIDSDGTRNSKDGAVCISSINDMFLYNVKKMLCSLGVKSTISMSKKRGKYYLPTHDDRSKDLYECKDVYRLTINSTNVNRLNSLGLNTHRANTYCNPNRDASKFIRITSIEDAGYADTVYCLTEPKRHTFIANGILTGNCSEQPLIPNGLCMLSSFNLGAYIEYPYTKHAFLNQEQLAKDVSVVVRAMDDIVEENIPLCPLEDQQEVSYKYRNIGIGIMGYADALVKLRMIYGSTAAVQWSRDFMKGFFNTVLQADVELAEERGSFPGFSEKIWDSDIIKHNCSESTIKVLKSKNKLRNCSLLSVAPTGSIGTMLSVSTGCESYFALSYNRRTVSMGENSYKVYVPTVNEFKKVTGYNSDELPEFFVAAHDIPWKNRIDMQAALQEACDTAISSTCNIPKDISVEEVEKMYLYAWSKGCKGFTCYRDGCREGVLTTSDTPTGQSGRKAPKRPKDLEADWYQVVAKGRLFNVFVGLYEGKPYEIFAKETEEKCQTNTSHGVITKVKKGVYTWQGVDDKGLLYDSNIAIMDEESPERVATLLASLGLRHGADIKYIVKTLKKTNPVISSFTAAMIRVLNKYNDSPVIEDTDVCPECGQKLKHEGGCKHCDSCGYSACMCIMSEELEENE